MSFLKLFQRSLNSIKEKGLKRTFQSFVSFIEDFIYDKRYGLNTRKIIEAEDLYKTDDEINQNNRYQATRLRHFRVLMKELSLPENSVFVDVGSGKGKVLLMATIYNFKRIVGIELSSKLNKIAKSNILIYNKRVKNNIPIELKELNVLDYTFEGDENIIYLYNPFSSEILEQFCEQLFISLKLNPRKIWLIFNNFNNYNDSIVKESLVQEKLEFSYGGTDFAVYKIM